MNAAPQLQQDNAMVASVQKLQRVYRVLNRNNLTLLQSIYTPDVRFSDPFGDIEGLAALTDYFSRLYENVSECRFEFGAAQQLGVQAWLPWVMHLRHRRLNGNRPIRVEGVSHLTGRDKIAGHRDYFDAGALLYENLPVFGAGVRWLKRRAHG